MKKLINFLMSIVVDVRMRSFVVLLEDYGIPVLHSQMVKSPATSSSKDYSGDIGTSKVCLGGPTSHGAHQIPREMKEKRPNDWHYLCRDF